MEVRQEVHITGGTEEDLVGNFFRGLIESKEINPEYPKTFAVMSSIDSKDNWLHMLTISDVLKATVVERRNDLNYVEYTFCSWL